MAKKVTKLQPVSTTFLVVAFEALFANYTDILLALLANCNNYTTSL